jgi:heavy metal efflux system protein
VSKSVRDRDRDAAHEVQRPVFYAITIIITAYLPIFTLQRVEGRLFRPMAWTVAFALLGAVIFSMTVAPVLASFLFRKETREWENPVLVWITKAIPARRYLDRSSPLGDGLVSVAGGVLQPIWLLQGERIGSEFLPHLDEGALWVRGTLAPSTGPTEGIRLIESGSAHPLFVSRSDPMLQSDGASGRRNRHHQLL